MWDYETDVCGWLWRGAVADMFEIAPQLLAKAKSV